MVKNTAICRAAGIVAAYSSELGAIDKIIGLTRSSSITFLMVSSGVTHKRVVLLIQSSD